MRDSLVWQNYPAIVLIFLERLLKRFKITYENHSPSPEYPAAHAAQALRGASFASSRTDKYMHALYMNAFFSQKCKITCNLSVYYSNYGAI